MATASPFPFMTWACPSTSRSPQSGFHRSLSTSRLLLNAISSAHNVDHKEQAPFCGYLFSTFQEVVGELHRRSRDRTPIANYLQVSNSYSARGLDSYLATDRSLVKRICCLVSEAFQSDNLGSEVAIVNNQQNASAASSSGTVRERQKVLQEEDQRLWSVVIPTYNRLPILSKCLQALEEQRDYSLAGIERYEIIVVDDGSTDGTVEFLTNGNRQNAATLAQLEYNEISKGDMKLKKVASTTESSTTISHRGGENSMSGRAKGRKLDKGIHENLKDCAVVQYSRQFPHVKLVQQEHAGATMARNFGLKFAEGGVIVFIDSDLVVTESFLKAHGEALREAFLEDGDDRAFTYGRVVNTSNFDDPKSERVKLTDYSAAFFATGNVAISHQRLLEAGELLGCNTDGPFDAEFSEYGWEDLELGVRLRQCGARVKHAPAAVGYHWHPAFSVEQLPKLIEQEKQRGRNGVRFYRKHPTLNVQLMIQMTPFHEILWFLLTLGGLLNEKTLEPILRRLVLAGRHRTAAALLSPVLNWHTVQAVKEESRKLNVR